VKKSLPQPVLLALIGSGGLAVLAVGWLILIHPLSHKTAGLRAQAQQVQQQVADDLAQTAAARGAIGTPAIKVADLYRLAKAMPSIPDLPDVLLELNQTAKSAGVVLDSISPAAPVDVGSGYSKLAISLTVKGDFFAVSDLLYRLRNLVSVRNGALKANGRLFSVDTVALTPVAGSKKVSAALTVGTYVFGGTSTAASSPTTTETTTTASTPPGPSAVGAP
jgi:Tfp pilus assembly protein PilO